MEGFIVLGFIVFGFTILGSICGIVALSRINRLIKDFETVKRHLRPLRDDLRKYERQPTIIEKEPTVPPGTAPVRVIEPSPVTPVQKGMESAIPPTPPPERENAMPPPP